MSSKCTEFFTLVTESTIENEWLLGHTKIVEYTFGETWSIVYYFFALLQ